jgi:ABC-type transport system involved in multi-copper enzyme maturation permease subunit
MALELRELRLLTVEGIRDAARRRIVPALVVICLLSLMMVNSCTQCTSDIDIQGAGAPIELDVLLWTGVGVLLILSYWITVLAGLLASDHLSAMLEDGSALLVLSRPVSRSSLALSRLLGSLAISFGAGVVLLLGAAFLLYTRSGLSPYPVLLALAATFLSCVCVASFAMTASLFLPRIVTFLLVFLAVSLVSVLNLVSASGGELGAVYSILDQYGPPFSTSVAVALVPWSGNAIELEHLVDVAARGLVWAAAGSSTLLYIFRRLDLTRLEPR